MIERRAVGVFPSYLEAEHAAHELERAGFEPSANSIVPTFVSRNATGASLRPTPGIVARGAVHGGFWGMIIGTIVSFVGFGMRPGYDPLFVRLVAMLLTGICLGGLAGVSLGALTSWSLSRKRLFGRTIGQTSAELSGLYVVCVDGDDEAESRARRILADLHSGAGVAEDRGTGEGLRAG